MQIRSCTPSNKDCGKVPEDKEMMQVIQAVLSKFSKENKDLVNPLIDTLNPEYVMPALMRGKAFVNRLIAEEIVDPKKLEGLALKDRMAIYARYGRYIQRNIGEKVSVEAICFCAGALMSKEARAIMQGVSREQLDNYIKVISQFNRLQANVFTAVN